MPESNPTVLPLLLKSSSRKGNNGRKMLSLSRSLRSVRKALSRVGNWNRLTGVVAIAAVVSDHPPTDALHWISCSSVAKARPWLSSSSAWLSPASKLVLAPAIHR